MQTHPVPLPHHDGPPPPRPVFNWSLALFLMGAFCCFPGALLILPLFLAPVFFAAARTAQQNYDRAVSEYNAYYGISTFLRPVPGQGYRR